MGLFDTLHIHRKFIPEVPEINEQGYSLESLQTKDFDNLLEDYYVDENGVLSVDKIEYETIENTNPPEKARWCPPFILQEKHRERINVPHTGIVIAGYFFGGNLLGEFDGKDEIFIDLKFKFIDGVLQDVGSVYELRITPADKVLERNKQYEEKRLKRENDPIYGITTKFSSVLGVVISKLTRLDYWLRSYEPK